MIASSPGHSHVFNIENVGVAWGRAYTGSVYIIIRDRDSTIKVYNYRAFPHCTEQYFCRFSYTASHDGQKVKR